MAEMAFSIEAKAVIMITGSSSSCLCSSSSTCKPSRPGIIMSTMTASKGSDLASSSPSEPLVASRTV
jgi:hypothetical protein